MKFYLVVSLVFLTLCADDIALYKKLQKEVLKKDVKLSKGGELKVYIKDVKDSNITKSVKNLLKKDKIAKTTKEYEAALKD